MTTSSPTLFRKATIRAGAFAIATGLALALPAAAGAQAYPTKPIRMLVGFPPGGGLDYTTRLLAPYLSETLGQPIVVENKGGAGGTIAMTEIARSAPDGYTLIVGNIGPMVLAPNMMAKPPYDPIKELSTISQVLETYFVAAVPADHPANSLKEFVEWAKRNDGKVNYASGGNGSITHLNGELLNKEGGLKMTHVPYKGSSPAVIDLIAGRTQIMIDVGAVLKPQIEAGKLKAIAVTSPTRDAQLPKVATAAEQGFPGMEVAGWQGLVGPAGLPKDVVAKLSAALAKALAVPEVREKLAKAGTPVRERDTAAFTAFVRAENERWKDIIKRSGATIQ
ncbi:MAG: Bug family tripartite tricarboxylate transporter substrate binding protein [Lautropia sp.]